MPLCARRTRVIDGPRHEALQEIGNNMREWLLAVALALSPLSAAADGLGTFTILEGQALIYRGSNRLSAARCVRSVSPSAIAASCCFAPASTRDAASLMNTDAAST